MTMFVPKPPTHPRMLCMKMLWSEGVVVAFGRAKFDVLPMLYLLLDRDSQVHDYG